MTAEDDVQIDNGEQETASALLALARELAGLAEPAEIAQRLAAAVPKVVDTDASAVVFFDHERGVLRVPGLWGWSDELTAAIEDFELPLDASPLIAQIVKDPIPVFVTPRLGDPVVLAVMEEFESEAALVVPLTTRGEVVGLVAAVKRGDTERPLSPELTERLQGLADIASTALDNALLYAALQEQLATVAEFEERYRTISGITSDIAYAYEIRADGTYAVDWATDGIEALSGFSGEAALELGGWAGLVVPEDAAILREHSLRVRSGSASSTEIRIRTKAGEERWVELSDTPRTDPATGAFKVVGAVRDITERRRAQQRLAEQEARLREAQAMAKIGSWRIGPDLHVTDWSEQMAVLFGWDGAGIPTMEWIAERVHPADMQGLAQAMVTAAESRDVVEHEYRIIKPDGLVRWLHTRVEAETDAAGEISAYRGTAQDVTERIDAEEYRRVIAEAVSDAAFSYTVVDGVLVLEWVSDAWHRLTGYPTDPTPESLFVPYAHPDDADVTDAAQNRVLRGERTVDEFRIRVADGSYRWLRIYAIPVKDSLSGEVLRVYGAAQDVTERRRVEEALAESESYLRNLIDASPLAVIVFEADGTASLVNPAAEKLFGFSLEEAQAVDGPPPWIGPDQLDEFRELGRLVASGAGVTDIETQRLHKDGSLIDVALSMAPLEPDANGLRGCLAVLTDIGERKQLEEELRQAQKMNAIGRLAGGVAHDFNNILTAVLGHAEFLLDDPGDIRVVAEHAEAIRFAAERAAALTEQMLMMSRHRAPVAELIDAGEEVRAMREMLSRLIGEQITFELRLSEAPCPVRVARSHLHQILLNLVVNARDAMPTGGTVLVETDVRGTDRGDVVVLRVSDTGPGIDADTRDRVFEPFFTTKETGVGLGLSVVYGIVQSNRGEIAITSAPGEGAAVEVTLPAVDHESLVVEAAPAPAPARARGRILLVEDEAEVRAVTAAALGRRGYEVVTAADAQEAVEMVGTLDQPIDILVTDLVMPHMGGEELAAWIRERWPELPVVMMSGYSELAPGEGEEISAPTRFLQKPFTPDALLDAVRDLLEPVAPGEGARTRAAGR